MLKRARYLLEALGLFVILALCRLMPLDAASALGGWLGRRLGPLSKADATARTNLQRIFPEATAEQREKWRLGMWDNLGRTVAELVHINRPIMHRRMRVTGDGIMQQLRMLPDQPVIFFSAHLGNWELAPKTAYLYGIPIELIYRPANNPYVEWLVTKVRKGSYDRLHHKGPKGAMKLMRSLKDGGKVGMLIDQKMNDGIQVEFMGQPAMTGHATAELAMRYGAWLVPAQVVREGGAHFTVHIHPPIQVPAHKPDKTESERLMQQLHDVMEGWIRQHPEQWFWVHNRWVK